jgi:hypothetical protein
MSKFAEFGRIAKELFLSKENMSFVEILRILKEEHGCELDVRTLRRWKKTDNWEEDRLRTYMTPQKLLNKLQEKQLDLLQSENPDPQLLYAINTLLKTLQEIEGDKKRQTLISNTGDEDELAKLTNLRNTLILTIQNNITNNKPAKEQLDELQKLDQVIQNTKKLNKESVTEKKVYIFGFDGKDHTAEVKADLEKNNRT